MGVKSKELFIKPQAADYRCIANFSLGDVVAFGLAQGKLPFYGSL